MTRKAWYALLAAMVVGVAALSGSMLYRANPTAEAQSPTPTPDPPADLKIVGQYVLGCNDLNGDTICQGGEPDLPAPTEIPVNQDFPINVRKVIHNNGPYEPVAAVTLKLATAPPDCTITPASHLEEINNMPVSVDLTLREPFTIHCNNPSSHTFAFDNEITVTTPGVTDPDPNNNKWHTDWTVAAVAQADLQIVSQTTVVWPSKINASQNVPVTVRKTVRNNGPYGPVAAPVAADVQGWLVPPTGCTFQPSVAIQQVTLAAAGSTTVDEQFTIHCSQGGLRTFQLCNRIQAKDPHIHDPDETNNERCRVLPSMTVEPNADVKITSQGFVTPPAEIPISTNVDVTLRKHIHNNGPASPVDISISTTASAPADCSATPKTVPGSITGVPVSVDQVVDEIWTIHCSQPSSHSFTFVNVIAPLYLNDSDPTNNQRSTVLDVKAIGKADVKIVSQALVLPPSQMDVSASVLVTLRKHLHNNGPFGPVQVSISPSASAPQDCTATPAPGNPTSVTLPVSVDTVVDEAWSVHCSKGSSHTFTFSDTIAVTSLHVTDPYPNNNSASTGLTVAAFDKADVKIVSQELVSPPSEIDVSQNVNLTLRKHLHNNGPFGPVEVSISPSASAPPDCTATFEGGSGGGGAGSTPAYQPPTYPSGSEPMPVVGFDMDPSGNSCPGDGTNCTLGTIDPCIEVADGASFSIDIFLEGLPAADSILGIGYGIEWGPPDFLDINSPQTHNSKTVNLLAQGGSPLDLSEVVPDTTSPHSVTVADFGAAEYNPPYTHGTLGRYQVTVPTGTAAGTYPLTLSGVSLGRDVPPAGDLCVDYGCTIWDGSFTPQYGLIAVNQSCPVAPTPTPAPTATPSPTATPTATPAPTPPPGVISLPVSVDTVLDEPFTIHCSTPSTHTFSFDNTIAITSPHVTDPNPDNNSASTDLTVAAIGKADVKIVSQSFVGPPAQIDVSANVPVTLRKVLHNNGPYTVDPVTVTVSKTATAPADCSITPPSTSVQVVLPYSVDVTADEQFTIHCSKASSHTFTVANEVSGPKEPHMVDPDMTNNSAETQLTVAAIDKADVKIVSQSLVSPPTQIDASASVSVTLRKHLHNGGPFSPVQVSISPSAVAPPDCTATPAQGNPTSATLPVSVDTVVEEGWSIHCSKASSHTFTFNDAIAVTSAHVTDPNTINNSAQTQLTVAALGKADVKVVSVSVSGPAEMDASQNANITVNTTLHNNGPYGPVEVGLAYAGSPPPDCSASTVDPPQVTLPVSVDVVDSHTWTIHCSKASSHTFTFRTDITGIKDPHVTDPILTNNSGSGSFTVNAIAYADMKVVTQQMQNPPAQIPISEDVLVTLDKVIHNNGPSEPVEAVTETTVTPPADCTVRPAVHTEQFHHVPVSVDILHHEPFIIHCYQIGSYTFTFDDAVSLKEPHLRDPVSNNNTAQTKLTVKSMAKADVRITSASFVDPPTKIPLNQDVDVTLRKHIHNNGPRSPVDIAITSTAAPPTGCTIVPKNVPASIPGVPVSVDQVVDEVWTVRCTQAGLKTFVFNNSIAVATPDVFDPNLANNAVRKLLTVRDPSYPYWGDDICDGLDNDGDTVIDEGWDLNGSPVADCLDPALDTDRDGLTNDVDADDDGDGWSDAQEGFMRTDPLNACPFDAYHDAWPPDVDNSGSVNIVDVLLFKSAMSGAYDRRYDLNTSGTIDIMDVLLYKPLLGRSCTGP